MFSHRLPLAAAKVIGRITARLLCSVGCSAHGIVRTYGEQSKITASSWFTQTAASAQQTYESSFRLRIVPPLERAGDARLASRSGARRTLKMLSIGRAGMV
jgi:hypothetical protein